MRRRSTSMYIVAGILPISFLAEKQRRTFLFKDRAFSGVKLGEHWILDPDPWLQGSKEIIILPSSSLAMAIFVLTSRGLN